jgi:hypothetical protein
MQLGPNTLALQRYFERKYRENARVVAFRRLSIDARKLAEAAANLAPTVSVGQARKGSAAQF